MPFLSTTTGVGVSDVMCMTDGRTGYVIYSSIAENHQVSIEKLTPDYTASTFENYGFFPDTYVEVGDVM